MAPRKKPQTNPNHETVSLDAVSQRLLIFLDIFWETHHAPVPGSVLSQRFHHDIKPIGMDILTLVRTEPLRGELHCFISRVGGLFVLLKRHWESLNIEEQVKLVTTIETRPTFGKKPGYDLPEGLVLDDGNPNEIVGGNKVKPGSVKRALTMRELADNPNLGVSNNGTVPESSTEELSS